MTATKLIVILGVVTLLFSGKKLPEFARNLGNGIREFKKACNGEETTTEIEVVEKDQDADRKP